MGLNINKTELEIWKVAPLPIIGLMKWYQMYLLGFHTKTVYKFGPFRQLGSNEDKKFNELFKLKTKVLFLFSTEQSLQSQLELTQGRT